MLAALFGIARARSRFQHKGEPVSKNLHKFNIGLGHLLEAAIAGETTKYKCFSVIDNAVLELGPLVDHAPREAVADWRLLDEMRFDETIKRSRFREVDKLVNSIDPDAPAVADKIKSEHAALGIWLASFDDFKTRFEPAS